MRKSVISILLVVVMLFSFHYAAAEKSFEEQDAEFDALTDSVKRLEAIEEVLQNELPIYPIKGWEGEYSFDAYTIVPVIADKQNGKQYAGMPFLITGTVLDIKGYGIDFKMDDGRYAIIAFDEYDSTKQEMVCFGNKPTRKGIRCNIFCTFSSFGYELLSDETYHFLASCTEQARIFCEKRGK